MVLRGLIRHTRQTWAISMRSVPAQVSATSSQGCVRALMALLDKLARKVTDACFGMGSMIY
jgi:hypothetical protein